MKKFLQQTLDRVSRVLEGGFSELKREETGATAVEYALIVGLIAVVIILAVTFLGQQISSIFSSIGNTLSHLL